MTNAAQKTQGDVSAFAKDLTKEPPRSPRDTLGGFVIAARAVDKCRSVINNSQGEYHSGCPLDNMFLDFAGISYDDFKAKIADGASDEELDAWIRATTKQKNRIDIIKWNNDFRYKRISELPENLQEYMEDYIPQVVPKGKIVYHFFDVYDYEEGRL